MTFAVIFEGDLQHCGSCTCHNKEGVDLHRSPFPSVAVNLDGRARFPVVGTLIENLHDEAISLTPFMKICQSALSGDCLADSHFKSTPGTSLSQGTWSSEG